MKADLAMLTTEDQTARVNEAISFVERTGWAIRDLRTGSTYWQDSTGAVCQGHITTFPPLHDQEAPGPVEVGEITAP